MLRILVVDDEISIIELIKRLIDPSIPAEVIGEATDGNGAYELIIRFKPDIVITDIRMPGLSGVELVQKARENGLTCDFILVSGYKDFNYARSAIRYGVLDYLLKPINREELNQLIASVYEKQKKSNHMKKQLEIAEKQLAQNQSILRRELMLRCIEATQNGRTHDEADQYAGSFLHEAGIYSVAIIKLDTELEDGEDFFIQRNTELISRQYIRRIQDCCQELEELCVGSRNYLLIQAADEGRLAEIRRRLEQSLGERSPQFYPFIVTIAMGNAAESVGELPKCFLTADQTLWERLAKGCGRFLLYSRDVKMVGEKNETISNENQSGLEKAILTLNKQAAKERLEDCLENMQAESGPVYQLKDRICRLLEFVEAITENSGVQAFGEDLKEMKQKLDDCMDEEQLISWCFRCCRKMIENCVGRKTEGNSRAVGQVQQYLRENFREEINLEKIAAKVGLTGAYISTIFKKETGMTLTSFLIQTRIEKAKELIRTTNMTINEIAYAVGYVDARYFSKLFIKIVGIKPVEYRRFYGK